MAGIRVLVVEGNPENLRLMRYLLEAAGHEVTTARNGAEGVAEVERVRPDVVVMDVQMPVLDGYGAVGRIKAAPELAAIPLVAVTAYAMVGDRETMMAAGFDGYLTKPIDPETFARDLARFLPEGPA